MNDATIKETILIEGTLELLSPLLVGDGEKQSELIDMLALRNRNGKAYIPGTSMAGVLRHTLGSYLDYDMALQQVLRDILFGSIQDADVEANQSALRFFDVVLENAQVTQRDGVSLMYGSRIAKEGQLYDYEAIDRGAKGDFLMECILREGHIKSLRTYLEKKDGNTWDDSAVLEFLENTVRCLVNILFSGVAVGKFTTKGFGKIQVQDCKATQYRLKSNASIRHWLYRETSTCAEDATYTGTHITPKQETLVMKVSANIATSLIVRTQGDNPAIDSTMLTSQGDYVIPGSSVKGVIRHHTQYILEKMGLWEVWNTPNQEGVTRFDTLFGGMKKVNNVVTGLVKSRVSVDEVYIKKSKQVVAKPQTRNRIDRFTGGTIDSALFTEEPIWQVNSNADGTISIELEVKHCTPEEAGLFIIVFRDLWMGKLTFGGEASVGRGRIFGVQGSISYQQDTFTFTNETKGSNTSYAVLSEGDVNQLNQYISKLM